MRGGNLFADKKEIKRCIIHLHTDYSYSPLENSSGRQPFSMEELLLKARSEGIDVIIPTDHASAAFLWKPFPLAGILSIQKKFPSIIEKGPENYLLDIARLNRKYRNITIIPGAEAAADYWWESPSILPLNKKDAITLHLRGWHRHMLVIGLEDPADYYNMPVPGAPRKPECGGLDLLLIWPIVLIVAGWAIIRRSPVKGLLIFIAGALLMWGNYPFCKNNSGRVVMACGNKLSSVGSGGGDADNRENFQQLIDYTRRKGGLIFWAHPEAKNEKTYNFFNKFNILSRTEPYQELLLRTSGYNGFAIFAEGYRTVGNPGGIWDELLMDYCQGRMTAPVWAISEVDFGGENAPDNFPLMGILQNVIWLEPSSLPLRQRVVEMLKKGRFYALWKSGKEGIVINDFYIQKKRALPGTAKSAGLTEEPKAVFGETIEIEEGDEIKIFMDVSFSDGRRQAAKIIMVADGKTAGIFETTLPSKIIHRFEPAVPSDEIKSSDFKKPVATHPAPRRGYIRFFIDAGYPDYAATNPVFYTITKKQRGKSSL